MARADLSVLLFGQHFGIKTTCSFTIKRHSCQGGNGAVLPACEAFYFATRTSLSNLRAAHAAPGPPRPVTVH